MSSSRTSLRLKTEIPAESAVSFCPSKSEMRPSVEANKHSRAGANRWTRNYLHGGGELWSC